MSDQTESQDGSTVLTPGTLIGEHYQIVKLLGEGGMGAVYLVQDRVLSRYLALKVLHSEMSEIIESDAQFRQEARMLSRLSHPNVVTIHSFGTTDDGVAYITMEYVEGSTLGEQELPPEILAGVIQQVCNGLSEAHSRGIVHRDIKPANILLTSVAGVTHFAKVVDFGLALARKEEGDPSKPITWNEATTVVGTPAYMSPEQAMGHPIDSRSDIYALGVVACEMLTGHLPFEADTHYQMLVAHCREVPRLPSALAPHQGFTVGGPIDQVVAQALGKNPLERFQSVDAFGQAFADAISLLLGMVPTRNRTTISQTNLPTPVDEMTPPTGDDDTLMNLDPAEDDESQASSAPQVALLFVELDHLWRGTRAAPVTEIADCLAVVSAKIQQAVNEAGGRILQGLSDRMVAVFRSHHGLPSSTDDALRAGLMARAAIIDLAKDPTLPDAFAPRFRVAVDVGELFTGRGDDGELVFGDALVGARSLCRACPSESIVVSQRGYRHVRGLFECEALTGDAAPAGQRVVARRAIARTADAEIHGVPLELIGRDTELAELVTLVEQFSDSDRLKAVLLTGPAGVGKTRLVWELFEQIESGHEGPWIEVGRCTAGGTRVPYEPFLDALRGRLHITEDTSDDLVRLKAELFVRQSLAETPTELTGEDLDIVSFLTGLLGRDDALAETAAFVAVHGEGAQRALLFDRFVQLYKRMAAVAPLCLFIDNLQWASGLTRELLGYLMGQLKDLPVFVIASARPDARDAAAAALQREHIALNEVQVTPLDDAASEALVRHALRRLVEVPSHIIRDVCRLASGVPLIIEETIHDLIDEGVIQVDGARWRFGARVDGHLALPKTVEQLFTGRVARLPSHLRTALEIASVADAHFWPAQLKALSDDTLDDKVLAELSRRGLVRAQREVIIDGQDDYVFVQSAMREAVYSGVSNERRAALHLAVAEWLEPRLRTGGTQFDGLIGHHFLAGADPVRALPYLKQAAQHERAMYDLEAAIGSLEACLTTLSHIPANEMEETRRHELGLEFLAELIRLHVLTGHLQQAITSAERVSEWGSPSSVKARHSSAVAALWNGWALMRLGQYAESQKAFEPVSELLGDTPDADLTLQAATGIASTMDKLGDARGSVLLILDAIQAYGQTGSTERGGDVHLSAAYRALGNGLTLQTLYGEALEAYEVAYDLAEKVNAPEVLIDVMNGQAAVHYYQGKIAEAEETWRRALAIADKWDFIEHRTVLLNNLGELAWSRKDTAEALDLLVRAEALSRFVGMHIVEADGCRIQAEIQLSMGALDEAERQSQVSIAAAERVGAPHYLGPAHRTLALVLQARIDQGDKTVGLQARVKAALASALVAFERGDMAQEAETTRALQAKLR